MEQYFTKANVDFVRTREPGGTPEAEAIRSHILNPQFPREPDYQRGFMTEIFLFCAARADHVQRVIMPAINRGALVLCDRYYDSTMAYQTAAAPPEHRAHVQHVIRELNTMKFGIIEPDTTFLLHAPEEICNKRVFQRSGGKLDFIEQRASDYHTKVRHNFLEIAAAEPKRFIRIDANRQRREVLRDVLNHIISLRYGGGASIDQASFDAVPA